MSNPPQPDSDFSFKNSIERRIAGVEQLVNRSPWLSDLPSDFRVDSATSPGAASGSIPVGTAWTVTDGTITGDELTGFKDVATVPGFMQVDVLPKVNCNITFSWTGHYQTTEAVWRHAESRVHVSVNGGSDSLLAIKRVALFSTGPSIVTPGECSAIVSLTAGNNYRFKCISFTAAGAIQIWRGFWYLQMQASFRPRFV